MTKIFPNTSVYVVTGSGEVGTECVKTNLHFSLIPNARMCACTPLYIAERS